MKDWHDKLRDLFIETCPNCESAWSGGHPNPEDITWCVVCSDPRTGSLRGWVWRWERLHRFLVSGPNFRKTRQDMPVKGQDVHM